MPRSTACSRPSGRCPKRRKPMAVPRGGSWERPARLRPWTPSSWPRAWREEAATSSPATGRVSNASRRLIRKCGYRRSDFCSYLLSKGVSRALVRKVPTAEKRRYVMHPQEQDLVTFDLAQRFLQLGGGEGEEILLERIRADVAGGSRSLADVVDELGSDFLEQPG